MSRDEGTFVKAEVALRRAPWLWLGAAWAPARSVAFDAPRVAKLTGGALHECPEALAASSGHLLRSLGVRDAFVGADYATALRSLAASAGDGPLDDADSSSSS